MLYNSNIEHFWEQNRIEHERYYKQWLFFFWRLLYFLWSCYHNNSNIIDEHSYIWTITRAYRKQAKKPSKRGRMYILIVFLFSPPSLLIFIRLSSTWNTFTLYFYQPTTFRRWGTIHVIDLHPPARFLIAAARSSPGLCSWNIPYGSSIDLLDRSSLLRNENKKKISRIDTLSHLRKKNNNIYACKIVLINWHYAHDNCCSCYRNLQLQRITTTTTTTTNYITSRKIHNIPRASVGGTCVGEEGRKRRLGFGKKGKSSFTVHRSEEVLPEDTVGGRSGRQPSSASSDGEGSGDGDRSDISSLSYSVDSHLSFSHLSLYFPHKIFASLRKSEGPTEVLLQDANLKLYVPVTMNPCAKIHAWGDVVSSSIFNPWI